MVDVLIANIAWPALEYSGKMLGVWCILLSLIIEGVAIWRFLRLPLWKATLVTFAVNGFSTLVGVLLIPIAGAHVNILIENWNVLDSYYLPILIANFFVAYVLTVLLEIGFFWLAFPKTWTRKAWLVMPIANAITVAMAFFLLASPN